MKAEEFDKKFDSGEEDIIPELELSAMRRPGHEPQRLDLECPVGMIEALDQEASRVGVSRDSIIKVWLAERLEQLAKR